MRRSVAAACLGNAVEWYDFAIYGALGAVVTPIFFPSHGGASTLVVAFLVYATAFVMRPLAPRCSGYEPTPRVAAPVLVTVILLMSWPRRGSGCSRGTPPSGSSPPARCSCSGATQGLAAGGRARAGGGLHHGVGPRGPPGGVRRVAHGDPRAGAGRGAGGRAAWCMLLPAERRWQAGWWRPAFLLALPLGLFGTYLRRRVTEPRSSWPPRGRVPGGRPIHACGCITARPGSPGSRSSPRGRWASTPSSCSCPTTWSRPAAARARLALLAAVLGLMVAAGAALALGALTDRVGRRPVVLLDHPGADRGRGADDGSRRERLVPGSRRGRGRGRRRHRGSPLARAARRDVPDRRPCHRAGHDRWTRDRGGGRHRATGGPAALYLGTGQALAPGVYVAVVGCVALLNVRRRSETAFTDLT